MDLQGNTLKRVVAFASLAEERNLKKILGDDHDVCMQLRAELNDPDFFKQIGVEMLAGPVADAEGNTLFAQATTRDNLVRILGKRKKRSSVAAVRDTIINMKQELGVPLTLDERRSLEAEAIKEILKV